MNQLKELALHTDLKRGEKIFYFSTTGPVIPSQIWQDCLSSCVYFLKLRPLHKKVPCCAFWSTPGWMMWNWLTCALGLGASIVLYDGNPLHPDANRLWQMTQDLKVKAIYVNTINAAEVDNIGLFTADQCIWHQCSLPFRHYGCQLQP